MHSCLKSVVCRGVIFGALITWPSVTRAQEPAGDRAGIVVSTGLASLPSVLSMQCGSGNGGDETGPEAGAALVVRKHRWLVLHADTRVAAPMLTGCKLSIPAVDTVFGEYLQPFATSTLRVGMETPPGLPLLRVTAGAGLAWGRGSLPLAVTSVAWSTRGQRVRFLIEGERTQMRVRARERRRGGDNFQIVESRSILLHPAVHTVRAGLEWPLGLRR